MVWTCYALVHLTYILIAYASTLIRGKTCRDVVFIYPKVATAIALFLVTLVFTTFFTVHPS